ncbi:MAG: hypothetical protein OHK0023_13710 [Anaerolineae bacterium]
MTVFKELLDYIFEGENSAFYPEFEGWMRNSRRFTDFASTYRNKIRTKLRNIRNDEAAKDVRAELEAAALLLHENLFTQLTYEKYAAAKQRGPDFTVTFKTHTPFNVEVRRIRGVELDIANRDARSSKLMAVLCEKVGQMPPSIINWLWLVAEQEVSASDLTHAVINVRLLAERKAEDYFIRRGFRSAAAFINQYQHLSGIFVRQRGAKMLWQNPMARHKALPDLANALQRLEAT